jgi:hypothetical protein
VSCFIGTDDVMERARSLPAAVSSSWNPGTQQLFEFASPVPRVAIGTISRRGDGVSPIVLGCSSRQIIPTSCPRSPSFS